MKTAKKNPAETMLVLATGCLFIFLFTEQRAWLYVSLVAGLVGILSPYLSTKIEWLWMGLARVLGYIVPNILLSLVYFLILTPLALLARLFSKKDPLQLKKPANSTFRDMDKVFNKSSLENPW